MAFWKEHVPGPPSFFMSRQQVEPSKMMINRRTNSNAKLPGTDSISGESVEAAGLAHTIISSKTVKKVVCAIASGDGLVGRRQSFHLIQLVMSSTHLSTASSLYCGRCIWAHKCRRAYMHK